MMLQPNYSAANPMLEGQVKPLAKEISNSNTSHLNPVPVPEHMLDEYRAVTIAGLERELNLPDSILSQDLCPELSSWLAAYPVRDTPLKNNFCVYDPEIDYSKVYAFATKNSQAAKNTDRVSKAMPPEWENPNPVKGWHGQRCPTIMDLLNYAEKSANWDDERYTYWSDKYCMLSPKRPSVDPTVSANEDTHELDTLGFNDKIWYVNEHLRYQSWLMWRGLEHESQYPSSGLEAFFEHVPHDVSDEYELLQIKLSEETAYPPSPLEAISRNGISVRRDFRVYVTPEPYVYRNPLKIYLHAVKRWHERGKGSPERLVRLYVKLGIQSAFFTPVNSTPPVEDEKEEETEECNFVLIGPPRDVFVEKVAQKVEALAPPEQKYIPSTEDVDELSDNLAHGMYFSQSIARVIAEHVSKKTVRDMLPAIEFGCRALVREEVNKHMSGLIIPDTLKARGFEIVGKAPELKFC